MSQMSQVSQMSQKYFLEYKVEGSEHFGEKIEIKSLYNLKRSSLLADLLDDEEADGDEDQIFPVMSGTFESFKILCDVLNSDIEIDQDTLPKPVYGTDVENWGVDKKIIDMLRDLEVGEFLDLLQTANYLNIQAFFQLLSAYAAYVISKQELIKVKTIFSDKTLKLESLEKVSTEKVN